MKCSVLLPSALLGLAATAGAAPWLSYHAPVPRAAMSLQSKEFTLAMTVNGTYVSLDAVSNGTDLLVLQAGTSPGTPTYANQTADTGSAFNTSLILDLANSTGADYPAGYYGLSVPDLGERYGATANVVAQQGYQDFGFQIDEDAIYHSLTSASQSWFACLDSLSGASQQSYFLKWGVFTAGGNVPEGCLVTNVVQVFNLPGGATKSPWAAGRSLRHW